MAFLASARAVCADAKLGFAVATPALAAEPDFKAKSPALPIAFTA